MPVSPKSLENLRTNVFSTENQPENYARQGRPLGVKNRKTLFNKWLEYETTTQINGKDVVVSVQEAMTIAMTKEAINGNVNAFTVLMDGVYGKVANVQITETVKKNFDPSKYSTEELQQLEKLMLKGYNSHIEEADVLE